MIKDTAVKKCSIIKEYVLLLIGLYKNNGSVLSVDNFYLVIPVARHLIGHHPIRHGLNFDQHPTGTIVAYLVACHQDMSVLTLPLNPDI